jgi:HK97 family phage portal protein
MLNWLTHLFNPRRASGLRPAPHLEAVARHNTTLWPNLAETGAQAAVYRQSPWVYIAINRIAEAAALVPLRVLRLEGERRLEVPNHPLETLLDAPNPYLSRFELIEQTIGMLELTGNAYWFLAGDTTGVPAQIWPLRPDRVSIVPDPVEAVKGYLYEIDGQRIPLDPVEVVHFKRWHPANDYYGLSALEAARLAVHSDRAMARWNHNTFGPDNGVPAGIVSIQGAVSDADYDRIKREWRASFGGGQRRTAVLRGEAIQWQHIGLNHNELDFLKGREAHRDEILNIFGIPVGLVSDNATEANATVAERQFIERTLWPKLVRLAQKITQELLPFWSGTHQVIFEDIRPTDAQARLDEIRTAYPVLTVNEIRQRYFQLPAVTWGESPVGSSTTPVGTQSASSAAPTRFLHPETEVSRRGDPLDHPDEDGFGVRAADSALLTQHSLAELARWERFTLKRWGQPSPRPFEVRALPDDLAFEITAELLAADTPDAARAVFHAARDRLAITPR